MDSDANPPQAVPASSFLDILLTLPIEQQREALAWLRQVAAELGCATREEVLVHKDFLDFFPFINTPRSLN